MDHQRRRRRRRRRRRVPSANWHADAVAASTLCGRFRTGLYREKSIVRRVLFKEFGWQRPGHEISTSVAVTNLHKALTRSRAAPRPLRRRRTRRRPTRCRCWCPTRAGRPLGGASAARAPWPPVRPDR